MTSEEEYQFKVVLAKIYFYGGKFDQCRTTLDSLPKALGSDFALSPAYVKQLYMAQMVMQGIAEEMQGNLVLAHEIYEQPILEFKDKLSSQSVIVVPRSSSSSGHEELINWPEEALYRRAMVLLAMGDKTRGARALLSYIRQMDGVAPSTFRAFRRMRANRLYLQTVRSSIETGLLRSAEVKNEVLLGHRRQMALLKSVHSFPRACEAHDEVLYEVDCAASDWELVQASSRAETLILLEILYESVYLTYNSPRVLRHLVHALILFGDFHEASLAFGTYLTLVERQLEAVRKAMDAALSEGAQDLRIDFGPNFESVDDILQTTITGARQSLVHFSNAHDCLSFVHFANGLIGDVEQKDPGHVVIPAITVATKAQLALWKGTAHGMLAQMSREPDNRYDHHTAALKLLQQAAEQLPRSFDAHYQLALEQAIGARDVASAILSAKQAVALDPRRIEAWHLLVLLTTSCKDYAKALQICDVALRQSEWWSVYLEVQQSTTNLPARGTLSNNLGLDMDYAANQSSNGGGGSEDQAPIEVPSSSTWPPAQPGHIESGIAFYELALTQMVIEGRFRGLDAGLEMQAPLFTLFGRIFGSAMGFGDESGDVSSAMESVHIGTDAMTFRSLRSGDSGAGARQTAPSQWSGRRSLARSLARTVFSKHARQRSYNAASEEALDVSSSAFRDLPARETALPSRQLVSSGDRPPLPPLTTCVDVPNRAAQTSLACGHGPADYVGNEDDFACVEETAQGITTSKYSGQPKRQRSMPHLRQPSSESIDPSPDIPSGAYFDSLGQFAERGSTNGLSSGGSGSRGGGRTNTVASMYSTSGVYYTPVATRLGQQRKLAKRALCSLWLVTAASFVSLQRLDEAANAISEALSAWPESPEALAMRGQLYMTQKQYFPALNELHAAVSLESNNIRASVNLARVEHLLGRRDVALGLLKNITRAHGWSDPEAWYWLGRLERELALEQAGSCSGDRHGDLGHMPTMKRAREYTAYALDLETSQPVRPFALLRL
ncbi:hypothetical protein EV174_000223 [Coemansia sp. RSA 2320]|nr:hypothetical protein EV174_000223 [Coemansia sp. RSA 2320]